MFNYRKDRKGINLEFRKAKRDSYCRACDSINKKDIDDVIYIYSMRNRGQNILLCPDCIKYMYNMITKERNDN